MSDFRFSPRKNQAHLIKWREWGEEAFLEAHEQDKLVLLSISAVWCHWCHVMDEESYSNDSIIKVINDRFIPIRVDNDRQPDVNRRYNMGGWPTTAVLNADGILIQGGTYIPPKKLLKFLIEIDHVYREKRESIEAKLEEVYNQAIEVGEPLREIDLREEMIAEIRGEILGNYDAQFGGFGKEPKFPHPEVLDFLLDEYAQTKSLSLAEVLHKTLHNMVVGGMFDREMGGFFRYSTTREWSVPHYEKMLEDNARLLGVYLKAAQIFENSEYGDVALDIIMFLKDWMIDHDRGTFYGSQDADETYYAMTRQEREQLLAPYVDKTVYTNWNAIAISAFFQAFSVLEALECRDIALQGLNFLLANCYKPSIGMYHYYLDGKGYNNALLEDQVTVADALLDAYEVTHLRHYVEHAEELGQIILERFLDKEDGGFFVDLPGATRVKQMGLLERPLAINSCTAHFFLRLEVMTGRAEYREIALQTLRLCGNIYHDYGLFAAPFARAVSAAIHGFTRVTIVGNYDDVVVRQLFQESMRVYTPHKVVEELDPIMEKERIEQLGFDPNQHRAYVCKGQTCYQPTDDVEELTRILAEV